MSTMPNLRCCTTEGNHIQIKHQTQCSGQSSVYASWLAIIFDRGLEKIRKLAQRHQGDRTTARDLTAYQPPSQQPPIIRTPCSGLRSMLALSLCPGCCPSTDRAPTPRHCPVLLPCRAKSKSCHVDGAVSQDAFTQSRWVKKGHASSGAVSFARKRFDERCWQSKQNKYVDKGLKCTTLYRARY